MSQLFSTVGVPRVVVASFWIWIASAALGLLSFFVGLPALLANPAVSAPTGPGIVIGSVGGAVIGAIVLLGLLATVFAGDLIGLLSGIAVLVAAVLMWLPSARFHFRRA